MPVDAKNEVFEVLPEVREALAAGRPVVALESTLVAHGMPWPRNADTARRLEDEVRSEGAVPATIAVLGGRLRVGLGADDLDYLARGGSSITKISRRDLSWVVASGGDGATTVAATMWIAERAGIHVFATGGIGGVHRGAAETFDISADLEELARTPVAVVCAGAKSILDLGLTLEYLETRGVPVLGFRTERFPAFFVRDSGYGVDRRVDEFGELAAIIDMQFRLGLGGVVVANPVPEPHQADPAATEAAILRALDDAQQQGVQGKALTPFLLARIDQLTSGDSLRANIELVLSNARVAARLAVALAAESG